MELELHSNLIYENHLDTERFAHMLDDPSQCYKFYWLGAILNLMAVNEGEISFDQIINEMICINKHWRSLILDNFSVIAGWIQLKKIRFLQDRNPGVPGIIYKLAPENESARKLSNARELWKCAADAGALSMRDIYTGETIETGNFDLNHFVPWSYVANDELWNLIPMEKRLNSSKGNKLPEWDKYFHGLAAMQYSLYKAIFSYEAIRKSFEKCRRDNLNALWASETLYIEGNSREQFTNILERNLKPIYDSAHLQGYGFWKLPAVV